MSDKVVETPLENDAFRYLVLLYLHLASIVRYPWSPIRYCVSTVVCAVSKTLENRILLRSVLTLLSLIMATLSARSALKAIHWLRYFVLVVILFLSSNYPWYVIATSWYLVPRDASRAISYILRAFIFTFVMSWNFCTRAR